MTHYMTTACILLAAVAAVAALFIRRAVLCRRRLRQMPPHEEMPIPEIPEWVCRQDGYETRYIYRRETFASDNTVRIRPEYYERLRRIAARSGAVSMIAYVDNVLRSHFEDNGEYIDRYCSKWDRWNRKK